MKWHRLGRTFLIRQVSMSAALLYLAVLPSLAVEPEQPEWALGAKLWNQKTYGPNSSKGSWAGGPFLSGRLALGWWGYGFLIHSSDDYENGKSVSIWDAEAMAGKAFDWLRVGLGVRFISYEQTRVAPDKFETYGPIAALSLQDAIGHSPFFWSVMATYMFLTETTRESGRGGGNQLNFEGGIGYTFDRFLMSVGYRYRRFEDWDVNTRGIVLNIAFRF